MQEKWGESDTAQLTIRSESERHLNVVNTAILEASLKIKSLSTQQKDKLFGTAEDQLQANVCKCIALRSCFLLTCYVILK